MCNHESWSLYVDERGRVVCGLCGECIKEFTDEEAEEELE